MKKFTFSLLLLISLFFSGYSQVQVGFGSNTTQQLPYNPQSNFSYTQSIYLGTEINAPGTITSIQWYYNGTGALTNSQDLVIYMGTTTKTAFSSLTDWEPATNLTMVFNSVIITNSTPGWKTITLDTPFVYNGTSNLIVAVDENTSGFDTGTNKFLNSAVLGNRSMGYYNNSINPDPQSPPISGTIAFNASYVPNIIFGGITQTCATPYYLNVSNVNTTTATVTWQASATAPANGSDYYVSTSNIPPTALTVPTGNVTSGIAANLVSLTPNTQYYVWVRNKCGSNIFSSWSDAVIFSTSCLPIASFNENFDGLDVTVPNLPGCWSKILRGATLSASAAVKTVIGNSNSAPNSVSLNNSGSTGIYDIILKSPNLSTLSLGTYRLKFHAKGAGNLEVGTLDNANPSDVVFTPLSNGAITTTAAMAQYTVNFTSYTGTNTYIGIRLSTTTTFNTIYLDNILWELIPNCPDVSQITVPTVTPNSATIDWEIGGTETSWDIAVGLATVSDPSTLPFVNTTNPVPLIVSGLTDASDYKVWVRSVCAVGGNGAWIGPVAFRTDCLPVATLDQNFDNVVVPNLPICWTKILRGATISANAVVKTSTTNFNSAPNSLQLANSSSTGSYEVIAVSPNLNSLSLGTYRLKFKAKGPGTIEIGTLNSNTNLSIFTPIPVGSVITTTATSQQFVVEFDNYTGTDTHIGIRLSNAVSNINVYLDNIIWEVSPPCPDISDIAVPFVYPNSANITWTPSGSETSWNIAIGTSTDTDPTILPFFNSNTAGTYTATGLLPSTNYKVWVRSVCSLGNGVWIGPVSFITDCPSVATLNENFDTVVVPNLPSCWAKIVRGAGIQIGFAGITTQVNASSSSLPNDVIMKNAGSTGTYDIILVSPNVSTLVTGTYRLKFKAKTQSAGNIQVGTLNANTNSATFTPLTGYENILLTTTLTQYVINFSTYTGNNPYIGIRLSTPTTFSNVNIDDVIWEPLPLCADVSLINVPTTTNNSATVNWTAGSTETAWQVAVGPSTTTDPNTLTALPASTTTLEVLNLNAASTYKVWVRSVCSSENGAWIGPVIFYTQCAPVATLTENFDSVSFPNLPPCWSKIIRNGATADSNVAVGTGGATSAPNTVTIYGGSSLGFADIILVSPPVNTLSLGTYTLKFYASASNVIQVGTLNNNSNTATFNSIQEVTISESGPSQLYTVNFSSYTGPHTHIGIRLKTGSTTTSSQYASLDNITWEGPLATEQFDLSQLNYYPNPVKDILNISYINEITAVSVYNLLGQEVATKSVNETLANIDMSQLAKGTYLVKVTSDNLVKTIKVIKE